MNPANCYKGNRRRRGVSAATGLSIASLLSAGLIASPARADSGFENGPIAYMQFAGDESHVMLIQPDGSESREVALPQPGFTPAWSTDGSRLVVTTFAMDTLRPMVVDPYSGDATILSVPEAGADLALLCRAWSPDDERILCTGDSISAEHPESNGIYSIRADGSELTRLTTDAFPPVFTEQGACGGGDRAGSYSPDGSRFVFVRVKCGSGPVPDRNERGSLFVADADGSDLRQLTPYGLPWSHEGDVARWSPDGSRILFGGAKGNLFTIRPDGGHLKQITLDVSGSRSFAIAPDWSPDGTRIIFTLFVDGPSGIFTATTDGNDLQLLVPIGTAFVNEADWGAATR